jgi:hypothetical protein
METVAITSSSIVDTIWREKHEAFDHLFISQCDVIHDNVLLSELTVKAGTHDKI